MCFRTLLPPMLLALCCTLSPTKTAMARGPILVTHAVEYTGWSPKILMLGAEREWVKSMHILERPNRPFHFYGNTVRRIYYRNLARNTAASAWFVAY